MEIIREILGALRNIPMISEASALALAGLVNKKDGSIHWPQKMIIIIRMATVDLPLRELIEREFNLPVLIENDATCACFGALAGFG